MAVDQVNMVDIVSLDLQGRCVLTISDHLVWGDGNHLLVLQAKLNRYLAFIESGELIENFPDYAGSPVVIKIALKYKPDSDGIRFLALAGEVIESAGFHFEDELFPQ